MTTTLHQSYTFLKFAFFISIVFGYAFSTNDIILSSTKSFTFSNNHTIVSPGDIFELGIFKLESSSHGADRWYLGIWFKNIFQRTYVWVANRYYPLSNPVGTIRVWESKLILYDQSNISIWSTNIAEESKGSPIMAELLDDGNFVLRQSNISEGGEILWQSFDSPTDTLLPGMKLGWEHKKGKYNYIRSWQNITDPSGGKFLYGIEFPLDIEDLGQSQGYPTMFIWSNSKKVNRISPWNDVSAVGVPQNKPLINFTFSLIVKREDLTFSFKISDVKYTSIMRLSPEGYIQHLMWNESSSIWDILWSSPNDKCDAYEFFGAYSYCDVQQLCYCMRGFVPKNLDAWALQNRGDGCIRKTPFNCNQFDFFHLINVKLPDTSKAMVDWETGFDKCKHICATDCSCTAFTTIEQNERSCCIIWTGELLDVRQYGADTKGHHLYVKQGKDKKPHTKV